MERYIVSAGGLVGGIKGAGKILVVDGVLAIIVCAAAAVQR